MNAEGWKSQRMPNVHFHISYSKEPQQEFWQLCIISPDREGMQNSKLTSGKVSDLYQSHDV